MPTDVSTIEGTWEEILAHSDELAGRQVRTALDSPDEHSQDGLPSEPRSTAGSLLKFADAWMDDDIEEQIAEVYATRSQAKF